MIKPDRNDIKMVGQHSNWSEKGIGRALVDSVYADKASWRLFLKLLVLTLGISFTVAGVIFFFAYNWDSLHKFFKLGIIEGLVIAATLMGVFVKTRPWVKKSILTGAAVLVGVLYAVFGQVYQTGADAYDFFLGWTLFISVWVFVSNFSPLWLVYMVLLNITVILYAQQVANNWPESLIFNILFVLNVLALIGFLFMPRLLKREASPNWFTNILALAAATYGTIGISSGIFGKQDSSFWLLFLMFSLFYGLGIWMALSKRRLFYIAIIGFSCIIVFCAFLLSLSEGAEIFFSMGAFIVVGITLLIRLLMTLQRKWNN